MKAIADTGFVVAFARLNDQHHKWAVDIAKGITEPLLTCEAVLAESAFHLESSGYVLSLVEDDVEEGPGPLPSLEGDGAERPASACAAPALALHQPSGSCVLEGSSSVVSMPVHVVPFDRL